MKFSITPYSLFIFFISFLSPSYFFGQNTDICQDGDCPKGIYSNNIGVPPIGNISPERTEKVKNAYLIFKGMKVQKTQNADWAKNYKANNLNGKDCMRMNELDAFFAHEYEQNNDFKNFINTIETNSKDFLESGFQACRRAINIYTRLKSNCPNELRKIKDTQFPTSDEVRKIYQKLGVVLGYFDEQGNQLKPLKDFAEEISSTAEELNQKIDDLTSETELKEKINDCDDGLNKLVARIQKLENKQSKRKKRWKKILDLPSKLLVKVSDINTKLNSLKLPLDGIPIVGDVLNILDALVSKSGVLSDKIEKLKKKEERIQNALNLFDNRLTKVRSKYDEKKLKIDQLDKELVELIAEKSGVKEKIKNGNTDPEEVKKTVLDFVKRYGIFETKTDCEDQKELENEIEDLNIEEEKIEENINIHEEKVKEVNEEVEQLEEETDEAEEAIKEQKSEVDEVKKQEEEIKAEYGEDITLEPVTIEEWSESFQVERPYWEAVFHPDDEVVEGYRGRYFEVQLKDAEKNVKLLFGPGEYFLSKTDFRKKYGKTIGSFVTEALAAMKKNDQEKIQLFIQGSADIAGAKTFSSNLDNQFLYEEIKLLPMKEDGESFGAFAVIKRTPRDNFRNPHLPNLRAQYLKEMIQVYSKKFDPVILEGAVKEFNDEGERNAIIYLFIPEELIKE